MLSSQLLFIIFAFSSSSLSVVHSLKCHSCEFQLKLGQALPDQSSLPEQCQTSEGNIALCKAFLTIDYLTDEVYVWWSPIPSDIVEDTADLLNLPLPLNRMQKSITKFELEVRFKPQDGFFVSALIFCQSNDFCIADETRRLLSQLFALKHVSSNIRQEIEPLIVRSSSSDSSVKCYHSFSEKIIDCGNVSDGACFIGIRPTSTEVAAGCTGDYDHLFVTVSYYVTNPTSRVKNGKGTCSMHCNRDQCNTINAQKKMIKIAQKHLSGSS